MYGRPGACYVDIAGDMVNAKVDRSKVRLVTPLKKKCFVFCICIASVIPAFNKVCCSRRVVSCCPSPPVSLAHHGAITEAISALKAAKRPVVIIGKGTNKRLISTVSIK